ncbi:MAG: hypothetical protein M3280_03775 [Actinomycetota bacterium]|nr:hypothetical protein [Actinomycetota bacterium]
MYKKVVLVVAVSACLAGVMAPSAHADGAVYYMAPTGSDNNPGTVEQPWRTFSESLEKLRAGDTLFARGGRYVENATGMVLHPGTSSAPIRVKAYPGERPVLEGLLWLRSPTYWRFNNIDVTWRDGNSSTSHMVKIGNGTNWVFRNSELWGARSFAALNVYSTVPGQPEGFKIARNCIHHTYPSNDTNQDHLMYLNPATDGSGGVIQNNVLFGAHNGNGIKLAGPDSSTGPGRVTVKRNTILDTGRSVLVGGKAHHTSVHHNILAGANNGPPVRGYQLSGTDNVAYKNVWTGASDMIYSDPGYPSRVQDLGGNMNIEPRFNSISCDGLDPTNSDFEGLRVGAL